MCHFGRLNQDIAGVNFTTPYVEATYVKDVKQVIPKDKPVTLAPILNQFLQKPITDASFTPRTNECIAGCSHFMPSLKKSAKAVAYFPGSLAIVGTNLNSRASVEVYLSESGYHALNIIKGGGAVSAAMTLVQNIENYSRSKYNSTNNHFPNGSHSPIPQEFVLKYDPKLLEERAKLTATQLQLAEKAGSSYRP